MSQFFINRPIVAIVISIVLVLVGSLTILNLPVAQFPNIAPPEIQRMAWDGTFVPPGDRGNYRFPLWRKRFEFKSVVDGGD